MNSRREEFVENIKVEKSKLKLRWDRVLKVGAAALVVIGGSVFKVVKDNEPRSLHQAFEMGETAESLNIPSNTVEKLNKLDEQIHDENTSNKQLIDLVDDTYKYALDITKGKIYNEMDKNFKKNNNITSKDDLELRSEDDTGGECPTTIEYVLNKKTNTSLDIGVSEEMSEFIKAIGTMQDRSEIARIGNEYDRDDLIDRCERGIKTIDNIAACNIRIVDKNIDVKITTVKDYNEYNKEKDDEER